MNLYPAHPVLLVDDEEEILTSLRITLALAGITNTILCPDGSAALDMARGQEIEAALLDVLMPGRKGDEILEGLLNVQPDLPVIMVTGVDDVDLAVSCMRKGAYDYIRKPADPERIVSALTRAFELRTMRRERRNLSAGFLNPAPPKSEAFSELVTHSPAMLRIFQYCEAIAASPEPVLITGETGVGKELLARAIHVASARKGEFVAVNVAGLDDQAFSDTLFGHVRGAFTGADRARGGFMERAAGGTLFLDEIGDLPLQAQIKLLRVLQEREFYPIGSDRPKPLTARIISATNRSEGELSDTQRFRSDFYFRIATHSLTIPPLRHRPEDIALLTDHFLAQAARTYGHEIEMPSRWLELLRKYAFPGNIRELRAMILDAAGRSRNGQLCLDALAEKLSPAQPARRCAMPDQMFSGFLELPTLQEGSEALVAEAMKRAGGNQRRAAMLLGITPQALNSRLKRRSSSPA
ncbi:sigma-54-dependent transcriptional regulator [Desulfomicrobium escambiense]|uniref:sigma-54-dependent transcriptional regulator n=1 Tax=Desulfomicrobium escambiense TaxID=29503 RepID=UPI000406D7C2|nr:sigma-54 dependent transcriptional regulator [Desulfomicrobium escambiense]